MAVFSVVVVFMGILLWAHFVRSEGVKNIFFWVYGIFALIGFFALQPHKLAFELPQGGPCAEYLGSCLSQWSFIFLFLSTLIPLIALLLYTRRVLLIGFVLSYSFLALGWLGLLAFFSLPVSPELGFGGLDVIVLVFALFAVTIFDAIALPFWFKLAVPKPKV